MRAPLRWGRPNRKVCASAERARAASVRGHKCTLGLFLLALHFGCCGWKYIRWAAAHGLASRLGRHPCLNMLLAFCLWRDGARRLHNAILLVNTFAPSARCGMVNDFRFCACSRNYESLLMLRSHRHGLQSEVNLRIKLLPFIGFNCRQPFVTVQWYYRNNHACACKTIAQQHASAHISRFAYVHVVTLVCACA